MAKVINGKTRITIENAASKPMVFETTSVSISSNNGGEHHHIAVAPARRVSLSCAKVEGYSRDDRAICDPQQSQEEQDMIAAAQAREMAVLEAAKRVADAQSAAEMLIENADHRLNVMIQKFLHTGQGNVAATKALEKGGIWASEDRTSAVACAELDKLYGVDTLHNGL